MSITFSSRKGLSSLKGGGEKLVNLARLRASLDETTLAAAWAEGRAMSVERAIVAALDQGENSPIDPLDKRKDLAV